MGSAGQRTAGLPFDRTFGGPTEVARPAWGQALVFSGETAAHL